MNNMYINNNSDDDNMMMILSCLEENEAHYSE